LIDALPISTHQSALVVLEASVSSLQHDDNRLSKTIHTLSSELTQVESTLHGLQDSITQISSRVDKLASFTPSGPITIPSPHLIKDYARCNSGACIIDNQTSWTMLHDFAWRMGLYSIVKDKYAHAKARLLDSTTVIRPDNCWLTESTGSAFIKLAEPAAISSIQLWSPPADLLSQNPIQPFKFQIHKAEPENADDLGKARLCYAVSMKPSKLLLEGTFNPRLPSPQTYTLKKTQPVEFIVLSVVSEDQPICVYRLSLFADQHDQSHA